MPPSPMPTAFVQVFWAIPAGTRNQDLAEQAIDLLFSDEVQLGFARRGMATPLLKVAEQVAAEDLFWKQIYPHTAEQRSAYRSSITPTTSMPNTGTGSPTSGTAPSCASGSTPAPGQRELRVRLDAGAARRCWRCCPAACSPCSASSGCGKTTLLKLVGGYWRPSSAPSSCMVET
ncbi:MAG: hypothetical protein U0736_20895 [Gemmataceae bacterium]